MRCGGGLNRHRYQKEFLCCSQCSDKRPMVELEKLWEICIRSFPEKEMQWGGKWKKMKENGRELLMSAKLEQREVFLRHFVEKIWIDGQKRLVILWKFMRI